MKIQKIQLVDNLNLGTLAYFDTKLIDMGNVQQTRFISGIDYDPKTMLATLQCTASVAEQNGGLDMVLIPLSEIRRMWPVKEKPVEDKPVLKQAK